MPELPELEVLREFFTPRLQGRRIAQVTVSPRLSFILRTPAADFPQALTGKRFQGITRRGKFLVFAIDGQDLVINPMLGGRLQWAPAADKVGADTVFQLALETGDELRFLDSVKMGRVYWTPHAALATVPGWSELGPEALDVPLDEFAHRIRRHPGELKNLLRNQSFIAGVGNAYSDEILHAAGFLPLRKRSTLKPPDIAALHAGTRTVLHSAIAAIRAQPGYVPHKQDRSFMAVHMKGGQACPRCGHRISELTSRGETTNFCRGCQR
jgi:formamidopyrimidine-DNA glycosylase